MLVQESAPCGSLLRIIFDSNVWYNTAGKNQMNSLQLIEIIHNKTYRKIKLLRLINYVLTTFWFQLLNDHHNLTLKISKWNICDQSCQYTNLLAQNMLKQAKYPNSKCSRDCNKCTQWTMKYEPLVQNIHWCLYMERLLAMDCRVVCLFLVWPKCQCN